MTDYVEKFVVWLGDTVTPLAAFTVGFFMCVIVFFGTPQARLRKCTPPP